jgi:hypothetical protein
MNTSITRRAVAALIQSKLTKKNKKTTFFFFLSRAEHQNEPERANKTTNSHPALFSRIFAISNSLAVIVGGRSKMLRRATAKIVAIQDYLSKQSPVLNFAISTVR